MHKNPQLAEIDAALEDLFSGILAMEESVQFKLERSRDNSFDTPHRKLSVRHREQITRYGGFDLRVRERIDARLATGLTPGSSATFSCWACLEPDFRQNGSTLVVLQKDLATGLISELGEELPEAFREGLGLLELWTADYLRRHGAAVCER